MVKRVIIGRSGAERLVDMIEQSAADASAANTRPGGNKVLEPGEDYYWARPDGSSHSMREVDEGLALAEGRIEDAEQALADSQVRLDDAEQQIQTTQSDLDTLENQTLPAAVQALEEADQAAQERLDILDGKVVEGGGSNNFYQPEPPTAEDDPAPSEGSLWFDTNDQNKPYIFRDGEWLSARDESFLSTAKNLTPWDPSTGDVHALNGQMSSVSGVIMKQNTGIYLPAPALPMMSILVEGVEEDPHTAATVALPFQGSLTGASAANEHVPDGTETPYESRPISASGRVLFKRVDGMPLPSLTVAARFFDVEGNDITPPGSSRATQWSRVLDMDDPAEATTANLYGATHIAVLDAVFDATPSGAVSFAMRWHISLPRMNGNWAIIREAEARVQVPSSGIADGAITESKVLPGSITTPLLAANAVTAGKMAVGTITADSGIIGSLDLGTLTAGTAKVKEAVIEKVWADGIAARTITASQVAVANGNLLPNGTFADGSNSGWDRAPEATVVPVVGPVALPSKYALKAENTSTLRPYSGPLIPVEPGEQYVFEVWMVADKADSRIFIELRDEDNNHASESNQKVLPEETGEASYLLSSEPVPTIWTKFQTVVNIRPGVTSARIGGIYYNHSTGTVQDATVWMTGFSLRKRTGATLIEPGAITTEKLTVTGDMSAAIVNAMTTNTKKLVVTEEAILNHATLIGQTVVDDINVQGKLIGTDGVFTGTVDFANINVTGEVLAENLTGAMIRGAEISTSLSGAAPFLHLGSSSGWPVVVMDDGVKDIPATLTVGRDGSGWGPHTYGGVFIEAGRDATDESHASFGVANGRSHLSTFDPNTTQQTALWMYPERVTLEYMDGDSPATGMYIVSDETYTDRASIEMRVGGGGGRVSASPTSALITARGGHAYSSTVEVGALSTGSGGMGIALTSSEDIFLTGEHPATGHPYFVKGSEIADHVIGSGWVGLPLGSGWNPRSTGGYFSGIRVRRSGKALEINGAVQGGSSGSLIATIPSGLRPTYDTFVITTLAGGGTGQAFVGKNGTIMHSYGQNSPGFLAFNVSIALD